MAMEVASDRQDHFEEEVAAGRCHLGRLERLVDQAC